MKILLFGLLASIALSSINASENRYAMFSGVLIYDGKPMFPSFNPLDEQWLFVETTSALRIRINKNTINGDVTFKEYRNSQLAAETHFRVNGYIHGQVRGGIRKQSAAVTLNLDGRYVFRGRINIEDGRQPYRLLSASGIINGEKRSINYNGFIARPAY